jgi:hypothetical protein
MNVNQNKLYFPFPVTLIKLIESLRPTGDGIIYELTNCTVYSYGTSVFKSGPCSVCVSI